MRLVVGTILCVAASAVMADNQSVMTSMQKTFELPAHRSLMAVMTEDETRLAAFESDGCSGGMSWSWRIVADIFPDFKQAQRETPPWETCCVVHDRAYHNAGGADDAEASFDARLAADNELRHCVATPAATEITAMASRYDVSEDQVQVAYDLIAESMYNAVRFGGAPCSGLPWRWGFGYPGCVPGF
ncbi:MAG: hypothetical protein AAF999_00635 [Pseudomonadota bacterium]